MLKPVAIAVCDICNEDTTRLLLGSTKQGTTLVTVSRDTASHDVWSKPTRSTCLVANINGHLSSVVRSNVARNRCGPVGAVAAIRMTGNVIVVIRRLIAANCVVRATSFRAPTKHRNCRLCPALFDPNCTEFASSCTPGCVELASQSEQSLATS